MMFHKAVGVVVAIVSLASFVALGLFSLFVGTLIPLGVAFAGGSAWAWAQASLKLMVPWAIWLGCTFAVYRQWRRGSDWGSLAAAAVPPLLMLGFALAMR